MTEVVIPYRPRAQFMPMHERTQRWGVGVAHVRAGKTVACFNDLLRGACECPLPDPRFAYFAPYFAQAKDVVWTYAKRFSAGIPGVKVNESELRIDLPNGGRVRLYGADNYQRISGTYLDGVVMDEYGDMNPRAWNEVIRARLSDRRGWAMFIGTPKGPNHFRDLWEAAQQDPEWFKFRLPASETGLLTADELESARRDLSEDDYLAQYECSFEASVVGAYFAREMESARRDGRVTRVPYQSELPVHTWWDLGVDDATAIWFTQDVGREVHVIDCLEASGEGLPWYARQLQAKGYVYGTHNAPHDIQVRELGSGKSRLETAKGLGIGFTLVPNVGRQDGIDAARAFIARCWFDDRGTEKGRLALVSYRKVWDDKRKVFQGQPMHDWCLTGDTVILTRNGEVPISKLPKTGEVLTPCGWKLYENPRITRISAPLVAVRFTDGLTVRCTQEHLFLTDKGWRSAVNLTAGSLIQSTLNLLPSSSRVSYTVCGPAVSIYRAVEGLCIAMSGVMHSVLSPMAATSIIKMGTLETTCCPTSNVYRKGSIFPYHGGLANRGLVSTSVLWPGRGRLTGTVPKKDASGIDEPPSDRGRGRNGVERTSLVRSVVLYTKRWLEKAIRRSTVARSANWLIIERVERLKEKEDVWCITVPNQECFSLSNGAVVHNSSNFADAFRYLAIGHKTQKIVSRETVRMRPGAGGSGGHGWLGV